MNLTTEHFKLPASELSDQMMRAGYSGSVIEGVFEGFRLGVNVRKNICAYMKDQLETICETTSNRMLEKKIDEILDHVQKLERELRSDKAK